MIPGTKEKEDQTLTDELTGVNVTVTFVHDANDDAWRWFRVSSDDHWRFVSLEIVQFPA